MLKRISKIKNIGRFKHATCGQLQFGKITLIFGRNTYGKSTLGDLLSSIALDDTSTLKARRTVPDDGELQEATITFQLGGGSEQAISIDNNTWNPALPEPIKLLVYDDGFYHNNVFAARQFTRSTKEKFSSFVLGAQGVAKAQEITEKNKRKRAVTGDRNKLHKAVFQDIEKLEEFLKLKPIGSIHELNKARDEKRKHYDDLNKQNKNSASILQRNDFGTLAWKADFQNSLDEINGCFQSSLETHHHAAREKLAEHIKLNFKNPHNAESWIRQGIDQNLGENCQFCGQKLETTAVGLLELYQQSFDDSFERHDKSVKQILTRCREKIFQNRTNELRVDIEKNGAAIISYPELEKNGRYNELSGEVSELVNILKQLLGEWESDTSTFQNQIDSAIEKKKESPNVALGMIQSSKLLRINVCILNTVHEINTRGTELNVIIRDFKNSIQNDKIAELLAQITEEGKRVERDVKRIELSEQCNEYMLLTTELNKLSQEIPNLQEQLRIEQSGFLKSYFERLNLHFKEFGSNDFKLEVGEDKSGHTPIYYLKVKFRNTDVSERVLEKVFSESDRRALSLAVFWARLSGASVEEKRNTIVVLDDPVTSFDNNRISSVHRKIVELSDEVRQIIGLSHYEQELSRFLSAYRNNKEICFLSIGTENGESTLQSESVDDFIKNDHEKARESILEFVEGKNNSHSAGDLRIFFEVEMGLRFAKQIREFNIYESNLSCRIDKLLEQGVIRDDVAKKCHRWRVALNPSHHTWMGSDIEDQRNTAGDFMEFVYKQLVPENI